MGVDLNTLTLENREKAMTVADLEQEIERLLQDHDSNDQNLKWELQKSEQNLQDAEDRLYQVEKRLQQFEDEAMEAVKSDS